MQEKNACAEGPAGGNGGGLAPLEQKADRLRQICREMGGVAVAFSGGADSSCLLKIAREALGDKVLAVTARSRSFPARELRAAEAFCRAEGVAHVVIDSEELAIQGFSQNPVNRCYLCKNELFSRIWAAARARGFTHVAEGSNLDDDGDYRPGRAALREQGVRSPLCEAGFGKEDIRALSRLLGLTTWDKPSFACLVSRFPYGESITAERLERVDRAEQFLLDLGLRQVRVRSHGDLARIETDGEGFALLTAERARVHTRLRALGFAYVAADLLGYRMGSMNETLA